MTKFEEIMNKVSITEYVLNKINSAEEVAKNISTK